MAAAYAESVQRTPETSTEHSSRSVLGLEKAKPALKTDWNVMNTASKTSKPVLPPITGACRDRPGSHGQIDDFDANLYSPTLAPRWRRTPERYSPSRSGMRPRPCSAPDTHPALSRCGTTATHFACSRTCSGMPLSAAAMISEVTSACVVQPVVRSFAIRCSPEVLTRLGV
jgi:hypothetical protein